MFQRYLYPLLAIITVFLSTNMVKAQNIVFHQSFDTYFGTSWNGDGSMLAVSTGSSIYVIDIHSYEIRQLEAFSVEEGDNTPSELFWSPDGTKLALWGYLPSDYSRSYLTILDVQSDEVLFSADNVNTPHFVAFSPDSRKAVMSFGDYIGGQAYDSQLNILDIESGTFTNWRFAAHMGATIGQVSWNPAGNQLAIQIGGRVIIYDEETQAEISSFRADPEYFYAFAWSPDGSEIVTYSYNLRRWNAATGAAIRSFDAGGVLAEPGKARVVWLPDNTIIIKGNSRLNGFDAQSGNLLYHYELPEGVSADWSPLGRYAASRQEMELFIYAYEAIPAPAQTAFEVNIESLPRSSESDIADGLASWSPQGDILLTYESSITNLSQAEAPVYTVTVANAQLDKTLFSNDGRIVALGLSDRASSHYEVQVWDVQRNQMLHQFTGHRAAISELEFSADNSLLASGGSDMSIRIWDLSTGEQVSESWGHYGGIRDIVFSPDSLLLASVADETMRVWDTQTGEQLELVMPYTEYVIGGYYLLDVRFSPDGEHIIYHSSTYDEMQGGIQVHIWNRNPEQRWFFRESINCCLSDVMYSADGGFYALTNHYADVKLFELQSEAEIPFPPTECASSGLVIDEFRDYWNVSYSDNGVEPPIGNISEAHWLDFSPDGQVIARLMLQACLPSPLPADVTEEMFEYNTIWIVDTQTGALQFILRGNESPAYRMFFSPDGSQLLTQHLDETIKLWDVETGEEIPIAGL